MKLSIDSWSVRRAIGFANSPNWAENTNRITRAVEWLRTDYDNPLRMEQIASELGMSVVLVQATRPSAVLPKASRMGSLHAQAR